MEAKTICAHCGTLTPGRPLTCPQCGNDPRVAGRYRLEDVLGKGGQGVAWRARREPVGEPVCLKELRWATMGSLEDERRFTREGELLSGLSHPAIPQHHGAFAWGEGRAHALYIAQELVVGENLETERRRRGYELKEVVAIGREVAAVLDYLHARRPPVVHRDIKPSNLMRRVDGMIVLVDFGAARLIGLGGASQVSVAGTFGFMAPEQIRGEAGAPSDIYGLGMTLLVLLAGGEPEALLDEMNRPAPKRVRGLSAELEALLVEMVAARPDDRPSAKEVARRLATLGDGRAGRRAPSPASAVSTPVAGPEEPKTTPRRASALVALSSMLMIAGIGAAAFSIGSNAQSESDAMERARLEQEQTLAEAETRRVVAEQEAREREALLGAMPDEGPKAVVKAEPTPAEQVAADLARCRAGESRRCEGVMDAVRRKVEVPGWPEPLREVCEAKVPEACQQMALVFAQGVGGVEPSRIETRRYFEASCELNHLEGCGSAGRMAMKGDGGKADGDAAAVHFERACSGGNKDSCVNLGAVLAEGLAGAKRDRVRALRIFAELCGDKQRLGCENAEAMIGNGWGLESGKERLASFERMCEQRVGLACFKAAALFASGTGGARREPERARTLYTRGCDLGHRESCNKL